MQVDLLLLSVLAILTVCAIAVGFFLLHKYIGIKLRVLESDLSKKIKSEKDIVKAQVDAAVMGVNKITDQLSAQINRAIVKIDQHSKDVESQFNVDRVADVEQLAICSGLLAARAFHGEKSEYVVGSSLHGHASMIDILLLDKAKGIFPQPSNGIHLLEIGTTREKHWSQMSTSRLALVCRALGLKMQTVDIDPLNTASGKEAQRFYGATVSAVTNAGERCLENWSGELPKYIYIDAYDFDHGKHDESRQERYLRLQGSKITDEGCWKMHYDCAVQFAKKCPTEGVVVFDDVFYENGEWLGKGKTAVPYMLENGFEVVFRTDKTVVFKKTAIKEVSEALGNF